MELIDRYVAEVGRQLPEKMRADIESEIRSTLEDMVEDRGQKAGRPVDEALQCDVLKEYGSPEKVAASYLPPRYLIGPRLYPQFELVFRIVLAVIVGVGLFRFGVMVMQEAPVSSALVQLGAKAVLEIIASALSALGNVVFVFVILERAMVNVKIAAETWDPRNLPAVSEPERIKLAETIMEVVFSLGAVLVLNFYPQIIRIGFFNHGEWTFMPVLSDAFFRYLPWINAACGLQIVQNLILLRQGRWQPATRWFSVAVDIFGVGLTYAMLTGPALIHLTAEELQSVAQFEAHTAALVATMTNAGVYLALTVALIVESVEIVSTLYKLLVKSRRPSPAKA
jgi:hypothetical protein